MPASTLTAQPWWTDADRAELDLLAWEFVGAARAHRERCPTCSTGGPWCQPLQDAFQAVEDWRTTRMLRSEAAWLRAKRDALTEVA